MAEHNFTKIIQKYLREENLSSLASELGLSRTVLHDWVVSERLPSLKNIESVKKLADYLNMSLEELLIGEVVQLKDKTITKVEFIDSGQKFEIEIKKKL